MFLISDQISQPVPTPGNLLGDIHPVRIEAKGLSVSVKSKKERRTLLDNVTLSVPAGKLVAIMGSSGSGKTTLLNALAGRSVGVIEGDISFNGQRQERYIKSGLVAYVEQQDNLLPYVSVRETLRYVARLRLPQSLSISKKFAIVESVILELGLKECADTLIGDEWRKGISGGERRRVSVGVQLLTNPSVIFLDEPTTGLDAFNARSLIETLLTLAHKSRRTIVLSIHQARSDIFKYFDQIALLARGGRLAFCGTPHAGVEFLQGLGFPLSEGVNGADYLVDAVAIDDRTEELEAETTGNLARILEAWNTVAQQVQPLGIQESPVEHLSQIQGAGFIEQVLVIARRVLVNLWEDRLMQWGSFLNILVLGAVYGGMYFKLNEELPSIFARETLANAMASVTGYCSVLFLSYKLSYELKVFDRERRDKMYSVPAYLTAWVSLHFLFYGFLAIVYSAIVYFMVGLRTDASGYHFGVLALNSVLVQWVTVGYSLLVVALARDYGSASLIANLFCSCIFMAGGFLVIPSSLPVYGAWLRFFSMSFYSFQMFILNEFKDRQFECPSIPIDSSQQALCDGNNIITSLEVVNPLHVIILEFVALIVGTVLVAGLVLHFFPPKSVKHAEAVTRPKKDKSKAKTKKAGKAETAIDMERGKPPSIDIQLKDLTFKIVSNSSRLFKLTGSTPKEAIILDRVSASFSAGKLTAILGASGAGKSTLLQLLQARGLNLPSHLKTVESGELLHNGVKLSDNVVGACTASVRQDDTHLLAALTARETLVYAALLRLPQSWPKERKIHRAEEVLVQLGLKDCANTLVGGGDVKGLSGGEKRRLSVGLAMLMDPAVLLLDEPTSGLDSATARNMMTTLKSIAESGRTVICTVHQPRSDIYPLLDRVLLLARGGRVVFEGAGSRLVSHLAEHGHTLPALTNPADYALDVASVDLRNDVDEDASRTRVAQLVEAWTTSLKTSSVIEEEASRVDANLAEEVMVLASMKQLPFMQALGIVIRRSFLNLIRQPGLAIARIMNVFGAMIIFSLFYNKIGLSQSAVVSRISVIVSNHGHYAFEHQDRTLSTKVFFTAYTIIELPFEVISAFISAIFGKYAMGLQINPGYFALAIIACTFCGESIGIAFSAYFSKPGFSLQLLSLLVTIMVMMSGLFSVSLPQVLQDLNYISVMRYAARIMGSQEFLPTNTYECPEIGPCAYRNGNDVMELFGFPTGEYDLLLNIVGLVVTVVAYRLIAYFVMKGVFH
ncbi:UNVERIFIED_CONTAM: hypothetical protein HDU68_010243 [Siphonaria sp. JEL0065]|nr:hypothetical protein HDU68_010243 [Siphonaria sp. JEL0065]